MVVRGRLADLNSCPEGGFVYPSKKVAHKSTRVISSITIALEVLHLLEDLLVACNIHLEVIGLVLPLVLEGAQLFLELPSAILGKAWSKEHNLEFLEGSTHIAGLAKLINADLSGVFSTMSLSSA